MTPSLFTWRIDPPVVNADITGNEPMQRILGQVNPFIQEDTNNYDHEFWDKLIEDYA